VVKPKDQQVKMTASHQRRETECGSGGGSAGELPLLAGVARLDGVGFFLALAFRIPDRLLLLPRTLFETKEARYPDLRDESQALRNAAGSVDPIEKRRGPLAARSEVHDSNAAKSAISNERILGFERDPLSVVLCMVKRKVKPPSAVRWPKRWNAAEVEVEVGRIDLPGIGNLLARKHPFESTIVF
jgi:hypothetical protein